MNSKTVLLTFLVFQVFIHHPSSGTRLKRSSKTSCSKQIIQVSGPGEIKTPNYPENYPSEANCKWILTGPQGSKLNLFIVNLEIEQAADCDYDYLEVKNINLESVLNNVTKLCGTYKDKSYVSVGNQVQVNFVSDVNYEEKGFLLKYSILSDEKHSNCNQTLTSLSGVLASPNYPENYPNNIDCWIKIQVQDGMKINLRVPFLMLEYTHGQGCKYDFLRIYDGDQNSKLLSELCKEPPSSEIISTGNKMTINFHSDEYLNSKGFSASFYMTKENTQVKAKQVGDCQWIIGNNNGTIASPNFPKKYPSNALCMIIVHAPKNHVIKFKFLSMHLEQMSDNTLYDYVRLYDGTSTNSTILGTYAGVNKPNEAITSNGSSLLVQFKSDSLMELYGFKAEYEFIRNRETNFNPTSTEKSIETNGMGQSIIDELLTEKPYDMVITFGKSSIIKCSPRLKTTTITWMKGPTIIGAQRIDDLQILADNSLSIRKMSSDLEGSYTCLALAENGKTASIDFLIFAEKVETSGDCQSVFINKPENKTLLEGEFTFLGCFMDGATIKWKHNGAIISNTGDRIKILQNGYLAINNVQEKDGGIYTCLAHQANSGCIHTVSANVKVIKPANVERVCGKPVLNSPETNKPRLEHGKIVNGFAARKGAHPWMAMLTTPSLGVYCGGSLINERWIITAAHCFSIHVIPFSDIQVKLGKTDKSIAEDSERVYGVEDVITHRLFDQTTFNNDIALIKLKDHVTFSNYILPICLSSASFQQSKFFDRGPQIGTATGWGSKWHKGPKSRVLLEVALPIVDQAICKTATNYTVTSNMFCAGYALAGAGDTCSGDSGGPFGMKSEDQWYLVGVTSWGEKCSLANKYGYYTKVSNYITWIHDVIRI